MQSFAAIRGVRLAVSCRLMAEDTARPAVSVITNSYNGSSWIAGAMQSALDQTFADFEYLVVDDNSTDTTEQVVKSFVDPRILFYRLPSRLSVTGARSAAIARARGEWIAFLDQDDLWLPDKLARQLEEARKMPDCVLVYGRTERFGDKSLRRNFDPWFAHSNLPDGAIFEDILSRPSFISMSSLMIRRDVATELVPFPDYVRHCPDYYLALEMARRGNAAAVQDVCCRYNVHEGSMSQVYAAEIHLEAARIISEAARPGDRNLVRRRRRIGSSMAALAEWRSNRKAAGLERLFRNGSMSFLALRPFLHAYRNLLILVKGQR